MHNWSKYTFLLTIGWLFTATLGWAQQGVGLQWEPSTSYTWSLADRWKANTQAAVRQAFAETSENGTVGEYQLAFGQAQFFATYQWLTTLQISGGYLMRMNEPTQESRSFNHRFTEQVAFLLYFGQKRLANRIRTEQRFRNSGYINRWRYRISYDVPLNGQQIDPGEKYLIVSNEWLFSFNSQTRSHQNRLYLGIGWVANQKRKIETGLQYRLGGIGTGTLDNTLWLTTGFFWNQ